MLLRCDLSSSGSPESSEKGAAGDAAGETEKPKPIEKKKKPQVGAKKPRKSESKDDADHEPLGSHGNDDDDDEEGDTVEVMRRPAAKEKKTKKDTKEKDTKKKESKGKKTDKKRKRGEACSSDEAEETEELKAVRESMEQSMRLAQVAELIAHPPSDEEGCPLR